MREKAAKKSARSIKYLLSADRRLHRLSLKKITEPVKTSKLRRPNRSNNAARPVTSSHSPSYRDHAIVLGAIAVIAGIVLVAARSSTSPASTGAAPAKTSAVDSPVAKTRAAVAAPAAKPTPTPPVPATPTSARNAASVTVTGCLELDQNAFRLKDASGVDAPTARSWKSGFFKKRRSSIDVVDETNALKLRNYLGQRVAATGTLTNRELQARSLERVAPTCK